MLSRCLLLTGLFTLLSTCGLAQTQTQIRIGQTAGLTGAVAVSVAEATASARLYFDAVNMRGGMAGQKLELVSLDDQFDPKLTAQNAKTLIDQG